jgi:hypothetical protein
MSSNTWIQHTKEFAERKGIKYNEALKDPENKATYRMIKNGGSVKERLLATTQNQKELGANAGKKFISL